jgi:hypothetical protein
MSGARRLDWLLVAALTASFTFLSAALFGLCLP